MLFQKNIKVLTIICFENIYVDLIIKLNLMIQKLNIAGNIRDFIADDSFEIIKMITQ